MFPFTQDKEDRIGRIGENEVISSIRRWLGGANPALPRGIGDDAAVLPSPANSNLVLTNDSLVYGRHFDEFTSPSQAGAKLLKRNLSDVAAMGGQPLHSVLAITCGSDLSLSWLAEFFKGLSEAALTYGCEINGGDLAEGDPGTFSATLTLLGQAERPVPRQGGSPESWVWSTGVLGGSILGHHLTFEPRLAEGRWLAARDEIVALMDITDGLARDLTKMVPEGLQARIDLALVPVADGARAAAQDSGKPAVWHALTDGEDYELLFITQPGTDVDRFESAWAATFDTPLAAIGSLKDVSYMDELLTPKIAGLDGTPLIDGEGFEHFRPDHE